MTTQLLLIDDSDHDWRIDPQTRELGRRGIEQARQVLRSVPRRAGGEPEAATDEHEHAAATRRRPVAA